MEITATFRRLLKPLQYINIPVDIVALIVSGHSFIPVLAEEVEMIRKAQMVRYQVGSAGLRDQTPVCFHWLPSL